MSNARLGDISKNTSNLKDLTRTDSINLDWKFFKAILQGLALLHTVGIGHQKSGANPIKLFTPKDKFTNAS